MDLRNRFVKSATGQNWAKLYQNSNCENAANWPHIVKSVNGRMNYSVSLFIEFPKKELKENILNNKERMEGRKVRWHRRWLSLRGEKTGKSTQCRSKRGNIFYFNLERNEREKKEASQCTFSAPVLHSELHSTTFLQQRIVWQTHQKCQFQKSQKSLLKPAECKESRH